MYCTEMKRRNHNATYAYAKTTMHVVRFAFMLVKYEIVFSMSKSDIH